MICRTNKIDSFAAMWIITIVILSIYGVGVTWIDQTQDLANWLTSQLKWGQASNAFGGATSIIGGCRLILHLRQGVSASHSDDQLDGGLIIFNPRSVQDSFSMEGIHYH